MTEQTEKSYQKQAGLSSGGRGSTQFKQKGGKNMRWYKNVGLGFKTPRAAIDGNFVDKKCPFTGDVSIRGKLRSGIVKSTKMKRTCIIREDYLHYITKYNRYEKRHSNTACHVSPAFILRDGDQVTVGQCRPLSKTVRFNVLRVDRALGQDSKQFVGF